MDYSTRWQEACGIPSGDVSKAAEVLVTSFLRRSAVPRDLHSDQGHNFPSLLLKMLQQLLAVKKARSRLQP
jgi:hypothetical protein